MTAVILALNAGSTSLKFSLFATTRTSERLSLLYRGGVEGLGSEPRFLVYDATGQRQGDEQLTARGAISVAVLGGLDVLVFTGGIGEHAAPIRARVCRDARWLGVQLNVEANRTSGPKISAADSAVLVWVIPTDEDLMIARHTYNIVSAAETNNTYELPR